MRMDDVRIGMRVRITNLQSPDCLCVKPKYLKIRRAGATGVARQPIPGHGGDAWWVRHDDKPEGPSGAYLTEEFEPI